MKPHVDSPPRPCACPDCPTTVRDKDLCWPCWSSRRDYGECRRHLPRRTDFARAEVSFEAWREDGGPRSGAFQW